jgi:protein MpaA
LVAGRAYFDRDVLKRILAGCKGPGFSEKAGPTGEGLLRVWHNFVPGHSYVIGADTSEGLAEKWSPESELAGGEKSKHDASAAVVFERGTARLMAAEKEKPYKSSGDYERLVQKLTCDVDDPDADSKIQVKKITYGHTMKKRHLVAHIVEPSRTAHREQKNIFLLAAQHGDERNTKRVLDYFVREMKLLSRDFRNERRIIIVPLYNPDGYKKNQRMTTGEIDLNRDFPTSDGDEENPKSPETRAFMKLLKKYPPTRIYNIHQPFRVVLAPEGDEEVAKPFATLADYPLGQDVGYPTPGSLGTYGRENNIPVITVELARSMKRIMAPYIYEEVRLALFHAAFGCIPAPARKSRLEKYLETGGL